MADRSAHNLDSQAELIWIQGYVTGRNAERAYWKHLGSATVGGDMDPEGLATWVDTFCRQNPLKELYEAATGLLWHLTTSRRRAAGGLAAHLSG